MSKRTVFDFQRRADWRARKSHNRGSTGTARRLERDKVMQVRGLRGNEKVVITLRSGLSCRKSACLSVTLVHPTQGVEAFSNIS